MSNFIPMQCPSCKSEESVSFERTETIWTDGQLLGWTEWKPIPGAAELLDIDAVLDRKEDIIETRTIKTTTKFTCDKCKFSSEEAMEFYPKESV